MTGEDPEAQVSSILQEAACTSVPHVEAHGLLPTHSEGPSEHKTHRDEEH